MSAQHHPPAAMVAARLACCLLLAAGEYFSLPQANKNRPTSVCLAKRSAPMYKIRHPAAVIQPGPNFFRSDRRFVTLGIWIVALRDCISCFTAIRALDGQLQYQGHPPGVHMRTSSLARVVGQAANPVR
jgi:hypothetical protein